MLSGANCEQLLSEDWYALAAHVLMYLKQCLDVDQHIQMVAGFEVVG